MSLRAFLTRLIALCVLPLLVISIWLAWSHVRDHRAETGREAERLLRSAANAIDLDLGMRIGALRTLAGTAPTPEAAAGRDVYEAARDFRALFGGEVVMIDAQRRARWHTVVPFEPGTPLPALPRPRGRSALEQAFRTGQAAVGDLFQGPLATEPLLAVAAPQSQNDTVNFVLVGLVRASDLQRRFNAVALPAGWTMTLRDGAGDAIARVGDASEAGDSAPYKVRLQTADWHAEIQVPASLSRQALMLASVDVVLTLLGATAASLLGGLWAGRRLSRQVRSLADPSRDAAAQAAREITEVAAVRQRLLDAAAARDHAESERQRSEREYQHTLEQAAMDLEVKEVQLRGIFDSASDPILTTDATQAIVMANRAAAATFGYQVEDLIGQPLDKLVPERHRAQHRQSMRDFGETDSSTRRMRDGRSVMALHADGHEFPIEAAISHVHIDGRRLFTVILRDVTARREAERQLHDSRTQLQASQAELRRLVAAQDRVQEDERKRIAMELHDDLQQTLAAILMEVKAAGGDGAFDRIGQLTGSALASTRRIVNDLRPRMLEDLGLVPALQALTRQFADLHGLECTLLAPDVDATQEAQLHSLSTCLYRVTQEALNNVAKHAEATRVRVELDFDDAPPRARLCISDNGRGLQAHDAQHSAGFGLLGMRERVRAVGGTIGVRGAPGAGTTIDVEVPLEPAVASTG